MARQYFTQVPDLLDDYVPLDRLIPEPSLDDYVPLDRLIPEPSEEDLMLNMLIETGVIPE